MLNPLALLGVVFKPLFSRAALRTPFEKRAFNPPGSPKIESSSCPITDKASMAGSGNSNGGIVSIFWEVGGMKRP